MSVCICGECHREVRGDPAEFGPDESPICGPCWERIKLSAAINDFYERGLPAAHEGA